jgi:hypothetical protein
MFKMTLAVREVAAFEDLPVGAAFRVRFLPVMRFFQDEQHRATARRRR